MKTFPLFIFIFILGFTNIQVFAQCESARKICHEELKPYISDGQYRKVALTKGDTKEFQCTFYGKRPYKITTALDNEPGNVRWKLKTSQGNLLFDSRNVAHKPSMKLKFNNTSIFILEVSLPETKQEGCAVLLIGFDPE